MRDVQLAVAGLAEVGEGPVWDARFSELAWVDISAGILHRSAPLDGADEETRFATMLGAVAPRGPTGWVAAMSDGFAFIEGESMTTVDRALPKANQRMNDAKCDLRGRFWAGSTDMSFAAGFGALHRWDGTSPSTIVRSGLTLPNGLGWSPSGDTMYLVDSIDRTLYRAPFDLDSGSLGPLEPLAVFGRGLPDGLCVTDDGCVWVAVWGASAVHRLSPTGLVLETIEVPVSQPSSCAVGPDGTLFVTSARAGLSPAKIVGEPHAGSVFAVDIGVGAPAAAAFGG